MVGGDVLPGPMPRETLERLLALDRPVHFIHGNVDLAVLAQMDAPDANSVTYWGTVTGRPLPEQFRPGMCWNAEQLKPDYRALLASWPKIFRLEVDGLGPVLFCHSTPRSETEVFTRLTAEERLRPVFEGLGAAVAVCGHTHMQFDLRAGRTRVVNAGSAGMPFGQTGAFWVLLGPEVELRRTSYDLQRAAERIRATAYPDADQNARDLLQPQAEAAMLDLYSRVELQ